MRFKLRTETEKMPSVADLRARGGEVTVDVVPAADPRVNASDTMADDNVDFDEAVGEA
jgi:hypothetical protein